MKPLSELVKEWREIQGAPEANQGAPFFKGLNAKSRDCADELQAWLMEADLATRPRKNIGSGHEYPHGYNDALILIRRELLGTTRTEGKK